MLRSIPTIEPKFSVPVKPLKDQDQVSLEFRVGGQPEPKVTFYKNSHKLQPNESVDLSKLRKLMRVVDPLERVD